jgi:hypothetical protein
MGRDVRNRMAPSIWLVFLLAFCTGCSSEGSPSSARTSALSTAALGSAAVRATLEAVVEPRTTGDGPEFYNFAESVAIDGNVAVVGHARDTVGPNPEQGSAYVYLLEGGRWIEHQKLTASDGDRSDHYGASVAISGDTIAITAPAEGTTPSDLRGAVYVYERDGTVWTERQKIVRSDLFIPGEFGRAVSVAGNTLVVATSPPNGTFVYVRQGDTWTEEQELTLASSHADSVSVSGDTVLIGAPSEDESKGAVHVFVRTGMTWAEQQKLTPTAGTENAWFGGAVALSGDTALVGASGDEHQRGAVYFFVREAARWTLQQKIAGNEQIGHFGFTLALDGNTAVAGAVSLGFNASPDFQIFERSGTNWRAAHAISRSGFYDISPSQGQAAVSADMVLLAGTQDLVGQAKTYERKQGTWVEHQALTTRDGSGFDRLGTCVALGSERAAVGASGEGVIYTYARNGSAWGESQRISAPDAAGADGFGTAVAMSGNGLVVGAPSMNGVYVYRHTAASWTVEQFISGAFSGASSLGAAVTMDGDRVAIAGRVGNSSDPPQGGVYIYELSGTVWFPRALLVSDAPSLENFGVSVALSGDTLLVGAESIDYSRGAAYVYMRDGTRWTLQQKLVPNDGHQADFFGQKVALSGHTAIVTAPSDQTSNEIFGAAYVFVRQGTTWTEQQKLIPTQPDPPIGSFAVAVSVLGDTAVVGARGHLIPDPGRSAAYVFTRSGATWTEQLVLRARNDTVDDGFAAATAIHGDQLLVGAPETAGPPPYGKPSEGRAYFYGLSGLGGSTCSVAADCGSGHCVDGVCCDTPCTGQCEWCGGSTPGTCKATPPGAPPGDRAACSGTGVCAGQCDGTRRDSCVYSSTDTQCAAATCDGDDRVAAGTCDGAGSCSPGTPEDCGSYTCDATTGTCKLDCSRDADCRAGFVCIASDCKPAPDSDAGDDAGDGTAGTAGAGGNGATSGGTANADSGNGAAAGASTLDAGSKTDAGGSTPADDDGCGCRAAGSGRETGGLGMLASLLLVVLATGRFKSRRE